MQLINDDIKEVLAECYGDLSTAAKVLFPGRFHREFDPIHYEIFNKIQNSDSQYIAVAAPRGIGKTSINNLLLPAVNILFQEARYIVPVSSSATLAQQQSENLKRELLENVMIQKLFGDIRTGTFSKEQWVTKIGNKEICVMPRGAGQQVRGMLFRDYRPDLIIVDDLEDPEESYNEEQRKKLKKWFYESLLHCVDRGSRDWKIIVLGTVLHEDSLLVNLMDNPDWDSVSLEICDDNFNSNAPNFMTKAQIKALYDLMVEAGEVEGFYREYRNMPIPTGEHATFKSSYFKGYDEAGAGLASDHNVENIVIVDPAKTVKLESAHSAIVGVGVNMKNEAVYVRDVVDEKLHPHELYDEVCNMILKLRARVVGIEVTSLHEFITHPLKNEFARRAINVELIELHARGGQNEKGKIARIKQLLHYYRLGLVYHNKAVTGSLEAQLLSFPRAKRWDVMDAFGYLPEILEKGDRYMVGYDGRMDDARDVEAEYAELGYTEEEFDQLDFRLI